MFRLTPNTLQQFKYLKRSSFDAFSSSLSFFGIYVLKLSTLRTLIRAVLSKPVGISTVEYFVALFFGLSALFTCHLTDPARRPGITQHSTGSIPLYGHAVGTAVEGGFNSQRSRTILCPSVALINL